MLSLGSMLVFVVDEDILLGENENKNEKTNKQKKQRWKNK